MSQATTQIAATVARNIVLARKEHGLTQRQLGAIIDMDSRGISRWEHARVMPRPTKLAELAFALGRDPGWFYVDHEDDADEREAA